MAATTMTNIGSHVRCQTLAVRSVHGIRNQSSK